MSTTIAVFKDATFPDTDFLEVYIGTNGVCLYPHRKIGEECVGYKFWVRPEDVEAIIDAIRTAEYASR